MPSHFTKKVLKPVMLVAIVLCIFFPHVATGQTGCSSLYSLSLEAEDVLLVKITRVSGPKYGQVANAEIIESLKSSFSSKTIELPFSYREWKVGSRVIKPKQTFDEVKFVKGHQYVTLVQKSTSNASFFTNPHLAKTQYEVVPCETPTYFDLSKSGTRKLWLIKQYLVMESRQTELEKVSLLEKCLTHSAEDIRTDVVLALSHFAMPSVSEQIINTLKNDQSTLVRQTAANALASFHSDKIKQALIYAIRFDPSENVKIASAQSLSKYSDLHRYNQLITVYGAASYKLQEALIYGFQSSSKPEALPMLKSFYQKTPSPILQKELIVHAAKIQDYQATQFCFEAFQTSPNNYVKIAALKAISNSQITDFFFKLRPYLNNPCLKGNEKLNIELVQTLNELGDASEMLTILRDMATCPQVKLRRVAISLLIKSPQKESRLILKSLLIGENDPTLRHQIQDALN